MAQPYTPQPVVEVKKKGFPKWLIAGGIILVIIIIAAATAKPKDPNAVTAVSPTATTGTQAVVDTPVPPTAVPAALAPSYAEIADKKAALTDAQWDEYAKTLSGLRIDDWEGPVLNVDQKLFSDNYWVSVDLDGAGGAMNVAEAKVEVTKADALTITKGQIFTFSGDIDKVACVLTYCPVEVIRATWSVK